MSDVVRSAPTAGPTFDGTTVEASHAATPSYLERRAWVGEYFDRTAAESWKALTSDAPVSRIRATVREGRDRMRRTLLCWMPADMRGLRVLDAGCGTGMLAIDMAQRGAHVVAVDLSPTLVENGAERAQLAGVADRIAFHAGDMLDITHGVFDLAVGMDSLIHYDLPEIVSSLQQLTARTRGPVLFTVAPFSPILGTLLTIGRFFPRRDRSPRIVPIAERRLRQEVASSLPLLGWKIGRTTRIERGFYRSQAYELHR